MKKLTKKQKNIYPILHKTAMKTFICLLCIFIFVSYYYICICAYIFSNDNCELVIVYNTSFVEPKSVDQPYIWYKYILDDFFNKFTSNSKAINLKFMKIKSDSGINTLMPLEHYSDIAKKSVILNKIQFDHTKSLVSECEFYKNKTSSLEIQLLKAKVSYQNLIKDINDIVEEMNHSSKK